MTKITTKLLKKLFDSGIDTIFINKMRMSDLVANCSLDMDPCCDSDMIHKGFVGKFFYTMLVFVDEDTEVDKIFCLDIGKNKFSSYDINNESFEDADRLQIMIKTNKLLSFASTFSKKFKETGLTSSK